MAKKGGSRHVIRMGASKNLGVISRKTVRWLLAPAPGPHKKSESISMGVLVRDVLNKANDLHEVKKILNSKTPIMVDGRKIKDEKFAIGLMDIVSMPAEKKTYRMSLDGPKMVPKEIEAAVSGKKYLKVIGKHMIKGKKINITFHDGRNYLGDNHIHTGDTCVFSVPEFKLLTHIKLEPGVTCLVIEGKHKGEIAKLEKIIERPGSHDTEASLTGTSGEFVTVIKYLFAIDANYA